MNEHEMYIFKNSYVDFNEQFSNIEFGREQRQNGYEIGFFNEDTNERHGFCRELIKSDKITEGLCKDGKMSGYGRVIYQNGDYYIGQFINSEYNGQGKFVNKYDQIQEGIFKDGKLI